MIIDKELTEKIESRYPMPIALSYYSARIRKLSDPATQFKHTQDLFVAIFKFLTSLTIRAYLITGSKEPKINDLLKEFYQPTDGKWIELLRECLSTFHNKQQNLKDNSETINGPYELLFKLSSFYFNKIPDGKNNPAFKAAENLVNQNKKVSKEIIKQAKITSMFNLINKIRNVDVHSFTQDDPKVYQKIIDNIFVILNFILHELHFLEEYPLYNIDEVKVRRGVYFHEASLCMGTHFEPQQMKIENVSINNDELYLFSMNKQLDLSAPVNWALSLSPYLTVAHCPDCGQKRIFIFCKWAKNVIEYQSTGCTHSFIPDIRYKEFDDIRSFLEGKTSLKDLFRGKTLGTEIKDDLVGATPKSLHDANKLFESAQENLRNKEYVLAQKDFEEAVKINPDFGDAYFSLAMCNILEKRNIKTICKYLDKAVEIDPHNLKFLIASAKIYMTIEKNKEATCVLQKALDADPSHQEARVLFNQVRNENNGA
jgi:tetratricopeptide (TPR) repeat protein